MLGLAAGGSRWKLLGSAITTLLLLLVFAAAKATSAQPGCSCAGLGWCTSIPQTPASPAALSDQTPSTPGNLPETLLPKPPRSPNQNFLACLW